MPEKIYSKESCMHCHIQLPRNSNNMVTNPLTGVTCDTTHFGGYVCSWICKDKYEGYMRNLKQQYIDGVKV